MAGRKKIVGPGKHGSLAACIASLVTPNPILGFVVGLNVAVKSLFTSQAVEGEGCPKTVIFVSLFAVGHSFSDDLIGVFSQPCPSSKRGGFALGGKGRVNLAKDDCCMG